MSLDPRFYGPTILSVQKNFGHKIENFYLEIECGPTQSNLFIYWIAVLRYSSDLSTIIVVSSAKVSLLLSVVAKVMILCAADLYQ